MDRSDDTTSLERLVAEQLPAAVRFAQRLTGDADRAEEVVQEALLKAAMGWKTFRGQASFRTWLFRIVIHAFRDGVARRQRIETELPEALCDVRQVRPDAAVLMDELETLVAQRVSELPTRQREVLVLAAYEGLATREIAEVLEISEANVHATLHVARTRLRRQLSVYLAEKQ